MQRKTIWLSLWSINTHKEIYLMVSSLNNPFMCVNRRKLFSVSILGWFTTHISVPQVRYNGNLELLTLYLLFYTSRISHHKLCVILRLNWLLNWNKCPWLCCGSLFRSATKYNTDSVMGNCYTYTLVPWQKEWSKSPSEDLWLNLLCFPQMRLITRDTEFNEIHHLENPKPDRYDLREC